MAALEDYDSASAEFARLVATVDVNALDAPTPCSDWTLRQLLNHVVTGTQWFTSVVLDEPAPDRTVDQIGTDPSAAFALRADEFRAAMFAPGALDKLYRHPAGEFSGERFAALRTNEFLCHGWDLAAVTGAEPNFDDAVAGRCLAMLEAQLAGAERGAGKGFGVPVDQDPTSSNYDRLIAFAGRNATAW